MCLKPVYRCPNGPKISPGYDIYYRYHCLYYPRTEMDLKTVEKSFIADFDSKNNCTCCDRGFYSCLIKTYFLNKKTPYGRLTKINICFAVNALLGFLNHRLFTTSEKETVTPKLSAEKNSPLMSLFLDTVKVLYLKMY